MNYSKKFLLFNLNFVFRGALAVIRGFGDYMGSGTVIVTGGAGFIGSATCELLREIYDVIIVDNLYSGSIDNIKHLLRLDNVKFVKMDVTDHDELLRKLKPLIKDVSGIIHLASIVNIDEVNANPRRALEVNVLGTINVLEFMRRFDINRIVYASSVAVYGEPEYLPIDENHPLKPRNLYGLTKLMCEQILWRYYEDYGIKFIALRYFNVYGPRMRPGQYGSVIYKFIVSLLKSEIPIIYGDGNQTRDFIYVYDVAEANMKALDSDYVGILNIGTGREVSINELYNILCRLLGKYVKPKRGPPRIGDVRRSRANIEKAKKILKWKPKVDLLTGLRYTINFYERVISKKLNTCS